MVLTIIAISIGVFILGILSSQLLNRLIHKRNSTSFVMMSDLETMIKQQQEMTLNALDPVKTVLVDTKYQVQSLGSTIETMSGSISDRLDQLEERVDRLNGIDKKLDRLVQTVNERILGLEDRVTKIENKFHIA